MTTLVLIDDDILIHGAWKMVARHKNHNLICFQSVEEFLQSNSPKNIPIYLDYHFNSGANGMVLAKKLYEMGYEKLYITTGSSNVMSDLKSDEVSAIIGKDYPL